MPGRYDLPKGVTTIVFDADGTLCQTIKGHTFRHGADDWELIPGVQEALAHWRERGIQFAMASNQGGVAFGLLKKEEIERELVALGGRLGIHPAFVFACYTHPHARLPEYRASDTNRKPNPGMIRSAMGAHDVTPPQTLVVGDREEDYEAARNAGCAFVKAEVFFAGWSPPDAHDGSEDPR